MAVGFTMKMAVIPAKKAAGSGGCSPGGAERRRRSCGSAGGVPSAQRPARTGPLSAHPEALLGVLGTEPERLADGVPTDAAAACFGHLAAHVGLHFGQGLHGPLQKVEQQLGRKLRGVGQSWCLPRRRFGTWPLANTARDRSSCATPRFGRGLLRDDVVAQVVVGSTPSQ